MTCPRRNGTDTISHLLSWVSAWLLVLSLAFPRVAFASQPCPPGTSPSMVGPWVTGLVLALGAGGYCVYRSRTTGSRSVAVRWKLAAAGFVVVGVFAGVAFAMYQSFAGRCV